MTDLSIPIFLAAIIFCGVAFFYSSVGLGGGSSYTALLAVLGAGTQVIPTISLSLNILVTTIGSIVFLYQGHGRIGLIGPFLITSIPMAYIGGLLSIPKTVFYLLLLISLFLAAWRIYIPNQVSTISMEKKSQILWALFFGALLGLLAGIVGIGGGIYLVPLVIILGLGTEKEAAACGAVFVWANSIAGMAARLVAGSVNLMDYSPILLAVILGGIAGSLMGSAKFSPRTMQRILGSILIVAVLFMSRKILFLYLT